MPARSRQAIRTISRARRLAQCARDRAASSPAAAVTAAKSGQSVHPVHRRTEQFAALDQGQPANPVRARKDLATNSLGGKHAGQLPAPVGHTVG